MMIEHCAELEKWICSTITWVPVLLDVLSLDPSFLEPVVKVAKQESQDPEVSAAERINKFLEKKAKDRACPPKPRKPAARKSPKEGAGKKKHMPWAESDASKFAEDLPVSGAVISDAEDSERDEQRAEWSEARDEDISRETDDVIVGGVGGRPDVLICDTVPGSGVDDSGSPAIPNDPIEIDIDGQGAHLFFRKATSKTPKQRICRVSYIRPFTMKPSVSVYCQLHKTCSICKNRSLFPADYLTRVKEWLVAGEAFDRDQARNHKETYYEI